MGANEGIEVRADRPEDVLGSEALAFVAGLDRQFKSQRRRLLSARAERQRSLDSGEWPDFNPATRSVRASEWKIADVPKDLANRRVEITGPVERKMMINALNSGARVFMADFEDALSPTWDNVVQGQANLQDAARNALDYTSPDGRVYQVGERAATLMVRPRGWQLREHSAGLNAGRWDYIFSIIKKFRQRAEWVLPDRAQITMAVPFMRAYTDLLVHTCHTRGAHAIGGMAAFIPSRRDADVNARALARVREDKQRESADGFAGTWGAHPELVPLATEVFTAVLGDAPHQRQRRRESVRVGAHELLDIRVPDGEITEAGVRANVNVALQYLDSWLQGTGAAAIANLMEDAATAEISRAQLWESVRHRCTLPDGRIIDPALYLTIRRQESASLGAGGRRREAAELLDALVLASEFAEFLTLPAYRLLDAGPENRS